MALLGSPAPHCLEKQSLRHLLAGRAHLPLYSHRQPGVTGTKHLAQWRRMALRAEPLPTFRAASSAPAFHAALHADRLPLSLPKETSRTCFRCPPACKLRRSRITRQCCSVAHPSCMACPVGASRPECSPPVCLGRHPFHAHPRFTSPGSLYPPSGAHHVACALRPPLPCPQPSGPSVVDALRLLISP